MIKSEVLNLTTPRCGFEFAWLVEADTKFETPGVWKVNCLIPADKAAEIEEQLSGLLDRWKAQLKAGEPDTKFKLANMPWSYEERDGNPVFVIKAKMRVGGLNKDNKQWSNRPPVLQNAKGQPMTEEEKQKVSKMGPGTEGQVFLRCSGYSGNFGVGIKIQPEAAIIYKHVEYSKSSTSYGFQVEESTSEPATSTSASVSSGDEF